MTKFKCFVVLGLFVSVHSASLYSKPIDIPVEIVYSEEIPYETHFASKENTDGRRNLNEKIQLSVTELRQLSKAEENQHYGNPNGIRNLNEKIQLSPEDLLQADKHLPLAGDQEILLDFKSNAVEGNLESNSNQTASVQESLTPEYSIISTESSKPAETAFESLGESSTKKDTSTQQSTSLASTTEENDQDPNLVLLIQIAQNIVSNGLTNIRENIDNLGETGDGSNKNPPITSEQWDRLNQTISNFFSSLLERGTLKGDRENVLQDIVNGVQGVTNNFVKSLRVDATNATQNQKPGVGQNIMNIITTGVQRVTTSLTNISTRSTTGSTVLGNKDDQTTPAAVGPFQNIINQVGGAINNLNPFTQRPTAAPGSQGDVGTTPGNIFQNFANQVGQVINGLNPLNQGTTQAPGSQNEESTQGGPIQAVQNVFNQFGQAVNNIFNQGSTPAPGSQNEGSTSAGPVQQAIQNVVNAIGSLNPLNPSTAAPGSQNEGATTPGGPLQGAQNFVNQVGQGVQNVINQFGQTVNTLRPPGQGLQNVINQAGEVVSTLNPLNPGSTSSGTNLLEGAQNAVSQVVQAASTLNPLNQGSSPAPGNNLIQGGQNLINQVGQAINSGSSSPLSGPLQAIEAVGSHGQELVQGSVSQFPAEAIHDSVGCDDDLVGETVENLQKVSSKVIDQREMSNPEEKAEALLSDQEIMEAIE